MRFFWWLRRILYLWVRSKVVPEDPADELGLDPDKPVCYVLSSRSMSDLLVLDETCRNKKLPLPRHKTVPKSGGHASYLFLRGRGLWQVARKSGKRPPSGLFHLVRQAELDKEAEVQVVPVSVLWGRNPGKGERSIFKLLFFDDERAGIIQKFLIVLAQGRGNLIRFGQPISLRNLVDEGEGTEQTAKKLRRVLRIHFRRQRAATKGPSLPSRTHVVASLLRTSAVRRAIDEEAKKRGISHEKAEAKAARYLNEIAADTQYSMVKLFDKLLGWVWHKIFDGIVVKHSHRVRELANDYEVIYLPSHRSHMDYLLLGYTLFHEGVATPHVAAGVNLNFWPVGPLLRKGGAFYLRRSFGGNRLYAAVFNEYVHYLITKGHPLKFYLEGGRSRTGRLLRPKTGLLAMVVQSFLRNSDKPVALVPTYVGYDKVMEVRTYQSELRGAARRRESVGQLLKARKALKTRFGRAYIGFGEPIFLEQALTDFKSDWRASLPEGGAKPPWMHSFVNEVARETLEKINSTAVVSPVALFSLVILSSPQKAMAEEELLFMMNTWIKAMRQAPYGPDVAIPEGTAEENLEKVLSLYSVSRFQHPGGDIIYLDERQSVLLTYYRNNVLHLVAVPSLVASFFQYNDRVAEKDLVQGCARLYPFLKMDFFLPWSIEGSEKVIENVLNALIDLGLLLREEDGQIARTDFTSKEFSCLKFLGRALGPVFERYSISTALLASYGDGPVEREAFASQCQLMAQRISILNGLNEPEYFDRNLFRTYIELLKELEYVREDEDGCLHVDEALGDVSAKTLGLLSVDIRESIRRFADSIHQGAGQNHKEDSPGADSPTQAPPDEAAARALQSSSRH